MKSRKILPGPPVVRLVGHVDHPDFRDAMRLLHAGAQLADDGRSPELVVIAQSRPGAISELEVRRLRNAAPLAGVVGLLGSWCEGETRTGRPWPGVARVYWHEFPAWWRRQLALRAQGRCPDWARVEDFGLREISIEHPISNIQHREAVSRGVIVIWTNHRETSGALAEVFERAGYASVWRRPGLTNCVVRGATAGIWDGGQLDPPEAVELAGFCRSLARDSAPVVALLDFPRSDSADLARECGASAVMGKPWRNDVLVATVESLAHDSCMARVA